MTTMTEPALSQKESEGLLLVDKPRGVTSFDLVRQLRRKLGVKKIGHAGTLDPFATGVMVMLIGRRYTRLSNSFLGQDKEYVAEVKLGVATDSYDCDGEATAEHEGELPSLDQIKEALTHFQGAVMQTPPMFSAKKVGGKKLYELARAGKEIERQPVEVQMNTQLLSYDAPHLMIRVEASKGTYIRSIAHDLGQMLGCGAHLTQLQRIRSGPFQLDKCLGGSLDEIDPAEIIAHLQPILED